MIMVVKYTHLKSLNFHEKKRHPMLLTTEEYFSNIADILSSNTFTTASFTFKQNKR